VALSPIPALRTTAGWREVPIEPVDEPLVAVDAQARDDVRRTLREALHGSTTATLLVTHDPADVQALAHAVLRLREGRAAEGADTSLGP
jgi:ABC-type sulfate/molybdate transport systems ATPase subunit